jgi:predicted site-specific integrase-resolvase
MQNHTNGNFLPPPAAIISLSKWVEQVGVTAITAWRWRKKGWLKTINIAGRQYLTRESLDEFYRRANEG